MRVEQSWDCRLKVLMSQSGDITVRVLLITPTHLFYSFILPHCQCSSHLNAIFKEKNKSAHFLPVRDENLCLYHLSS